MRMKRKESMNVKDSVKKGKMKLIQKFERKGMSIAIILLINLM